MLDTDSFGLANYSCNINLSRTQGHIIFKRSTTRQVTLDAFFEVFEVNELEAFTVFFQ